jgi:signal transduction histidine kinase
VAICDSGPGISDEVKARIFDPFFTTKADGMGMGLAITRSIIDAHHGVIEVNGCNEQGGTTFAFTLPVPES